MNPFISIIIPFYGTADSALLQRCLDSIHGQGMEEENYEIIVADDDGKGLGAARNKGMRQAKGTYLMFVDADDYLFPNISYCFSYLLKYTPDICSFQMREVKKTGVVPHSFSYKWDVYISGAEYMSQNNFMGTAWRHFLNRNFLNIYGLAFAESCFHEDEDFVVKAYCLASTTLITDYPVYAYYRSASSIVHEMNLQVCFKRLNDFRNMLYRLRDLLLSFESDKNATPIQIKALRRRLNFVTIDYIRQMRRNRCRIKEINHRMNILKEEGLLPLPKERYSWKYCLVYPVINAYIRLFV